MPEEPTASGFACVGGFRNMAHCIGGRLVGPASSQIQDCQLVDSGIQCAGASTAATRTLAVTDASDLQRRRYTRVLQAHIRLARQVFPEGTTGAALDAITRSSLWNDGLDFGHGTGHGVGAFLGVHEGPQRISPVSHDVPLQEGMIVSNEPGFYETGWGGIRIEDDLLVTRSSCETLTHSAKALY